MGKKVRVPVKLAFKSHAAPKLPIPKTSCDAVLCEKNRAFPAVQLFFNYSFCTHILGNPGSGKTTFFLSLITGPLRKVFHKIYLVGPISSMRDTKNPFEDLPADQKFEEPSVEALNKIIDAVDKNKKDKKLSLLVLDDCASYLKDPGTARALTKLYQNHRHNNLSIFNLSQNDFCYPPRLRELISSFVMMKCTPKVRDQLFKDSTNYSTSETRKIAHYIFGGAEKEDHPAMLFCCETGRAFNGMSEEIIIASRGDGGEDGENTPPKTEVIHN
ncbi:MAG: hypothetical protein COB04_16165 [Gammaproteobacteria bacterium]|nr:MAG: hypothetical protein COB04_16165 [Gammaproteobacteria bacterium]